MPIELSEKQTEAYELVLSKDVDFLLYGGAMGGGKTWWGLLALIALCSEYPGSKWVVIRRDEDTLKRTTIPSFNKIFANEYSHLIQRQKEMEVLFKNGSSIMFMPESYYNDKELNRFRGLEVNGALLEEVNELQEGLLNILFTRIGRWKLPKMPPAKIFATCNPTNGWVKDRIYNPWREGKLNPRWRYIPAKITENPHLSTEYIRVVTENMPELDRLKFIEGDWDVSFAKNPFAYSYNSAVHESTEVVINTNQPIYTACDFNLNPFGQIFANIWIDNTGKLNIHVFDEVSIENGNIGLLCEYNKSRYGQYLDRYKLTGDAMGNNRTLNTPDNANYYEQIKNTLKLRNHQLEVYANPTHSNSRVDVNWILHNAIVRINPEKCPNLCRDMRFVECDAYGDIIKRDRNDPNQRADHLDCFRYLVNSFCTKYIRNKKLY